MFHSKKEADFYVKLKILKRAKKIIDFKLQPEFELQPKFRDAEGKMIRSIKYKADFIIYHDGKTEIVDVKGYRTETFNIKWKLLQFKYKDQGYLFTII